MATDAIARVDGSSDSLATGSIATPRERTDAAEVRRLVPDHNLSKRGRGIAGSSFAAEAAVVQVLADRPTRAAEQALAEVVLVEGGRTCATNATAPTEGLPRSLSRPGQFVAGDCKGDNAIVG